MLAGDDDPRSKARWVGVYLTWVLALWLGSSLALAAPPPGEEGGGQEGADTGEPDVPDSDSGAGEGSEPDRGHAEGPDAAAIGHLRTRARHIDALIAGELGPEVDADALFVIDLFAPGFGERGAEVQTLLQSIHEGRIARMLHEQAVAQARAEAEVEAQRRRPRRPPPEPEFDPPPEPPLPGPEATPLERAQAELTRALWRFLILPADERARLLDTHGAKRSEAARAREAEVRARARLERIRREASQLEAFMDGTLDDGVDPRALLRVDLADEDEICTEGRLARLLEREPVAAKHSPEAEPDEEGPGSDEGGASAGSEEEGETDGSEGVPSSDGPEFEQASLTEELSAAEAALDAARLRFLALELSERQALLDEHARRQAEAEELEAAAELAEADVETVEQVEEELTEAEDAAAQAKRERELAELAAAAARTAALRRMAEERARLLGVKESHANYRVELTRRRKETTVAHEVALALVQRVDEVAKLRVGSEREAAADALYTELRTALEDARERIGLALDSIAASKSGVEPVGEQLSGLPEGVDRSELATLRAELEASYAELVETEGEALWAAADDGRDDIVMLNEARLELLEMVSSELRDKMTNFGPEGVAQVRREIRQIVLELRYRLLALPRLGRSLVRALEQAPVPVLFALLQIAFAIMVFRTWRKRAEETMERWRDYFHQRERGNPRFNTALAVGLWYVDRIRRPLEWLGLCWVAYTVLRGEHQQLEVEVLWLIVLWLLLGSTVILLVDSIAAHESMVYGGGSSGRAELRIRSLRLVGLTVVLTGLVLSLTEESVGQGAIHHWVGRAVWWVAVPILLFVLIRWWKEHIFRRIQDDPEIPDNGVVRWIRAHTEGGMSFLAATVAGFYLFGRGFIRWILHRATTFEATRRLLAWMFRREVARQASNRREDEEPVNPLETEDYESFDPNMVPEIDVLSEAMAAVARDLLVEIIDLKVAHRGTLSALIGERGSGKSTFLRRLALDLEERAEDYEHVVDQAQAQAQAKTKTSEADEERHEEYGRLTIRRVQCPPGGFRQLQRVIAESVGLSRNTNREDLVKALSEQTPLVFLIDDAHRLVRPAIGGLEGLDKFADFAREVSGDASWITSIGSAAWQYVSRARGERVFFDQVLQLPRWNEDQIGQLIRERNRAARIIPSFDEIVIPQQFDVATFSEFEGERRPNAKERAERGYYRILWDYAKGNPAVALHFWRESLCVVSKAGEDKVKVRLFKEPSASALDEVGPTMHFVLRGVVQLEIASPEDLVACTQLPPADVADALRFAAARGWISRVGRRGERYRVTWHWYRAITDMLRRQHLLVM